MSDYFILYFVTLERGKETLSIVKLSLLCTCNLCGSTPCNKHTHHTSSFFFSFLKNPFLKRKEKSAMGILHHRTEERESING
jgi:hypothetical protein